MKNINKLILFLLPLLAIETYSQNSINYEAEDAVISDSIRTKTDNTASQNKYVGFGKKGSVKWNINNSASGWFSISFRYRAVEGDVAQKIEVNGKKYGIGFSGCNTWRDAHFKTFLEKGKNEIAMTPGYGNVDIDYLSIPADTLVLLPVLSPLQGTFYKDHPATITIFANAYGKKIKSIHAGERKINFSIQNFIHAEGAYHVILSKESLLSLSPGHNLLFFEFDDGSEANYALQVKEKVDYAGLTLIMFNVDHGNAVFALLPNGKKLLIDTGKETYTNSVVMPFLDSNHIDTIHYFVITHYHDDHAGGKDEIIKKYNVQHFFDYKSFNSGDTLSVGNTLATILNAFADGSNENESSLSFLLQWNGFTYSHGADNYAVNQSKILKKFGNAVKAHVFYANHHFHGSVNPNFIIKTNPSLVIISAQQAVYARGAYTDIYKELTEKTLYAAHARLTETLLTLETGTTVIRVNSSNDWYYETYMDNADIFLPLKPKLMDSSH